MVQNVSRDAEWTVCDGSSGANAGVTVLAGPVDSDGERAAPLADDQAVLVSNDAGAWLLWDGRRSPVDLANRAITDALGFGGTPRRPGPSRPACSTPSRSAPLAAPAIPDAGAPPRFLLPVAAPVGAVVAAFEADNTIRYYAVLPDGLQPVSQVLAAILRNTNSYGLNQPPRPVPTRCPDCRSPDSSTPTPTRTSRSPSWTRRQTRHLRPLGEIR